MRIVPYDSDEDIEDIDSVCILIKAIPFEGSFVPVFALIAPEDDYYLTLEEINCLMDGIEIASDRIDNLIALMLQSRMISQSEINDFLEEEPDDDSGEIN